MRNFKYTVDLEKLKLTDQELEYFYKDNQKTAFEATCNYALNVVFPHGLDFRSRRSYERILSALDITQVDTIELEEAEFEFLKALFLGESSRFQAAQVRLVGQYSRNLEISQSH